MKKKLAVEAQRAVNRVCAEEFGRAMWHTNNEEHVVGEAFIRFLNPSNQEEVAREIIARANTVGGFARYGAWCVLQTFAFSDDVRRSPEADSLLDKSIDYIRSQNYSSRDIEARLRGDVRARWAARFPGEVR